MQEKNLDDMHACKEGHEFASMMAGSLCGALQCHHAMMAGTMICNT
jgi:hypothetical protein